MRRSLWIAVLASLAVLAGPAAGAVSAASGNTYTTVGIPALVTVPFSFTVNVTGPNPVCGITYNKVTVTSAPYTFTVNPTPSWKVPNFFMVDECTGNPRGVNTPEINIPFDVNRSVLTDEDGQTITVINWESVPATAVLVTAAGKVLASTALPPFPSSTDGEFTISRAQAKALAAGGEIVATDVNGATMRFPITAAVGWALLGTSVEESRTFPDCSTVRWYYDAAGQPTNARTLPTDITKALALLQQHSGLTFVRTDDPATANLTFGWADLGAPSTSGQVTHHTVNGQTVGVLVQYNTKGRWPTDAYAGAGRVRGVPGRVWLVVRDTMLAMGFGKVRQANSVMFPIPNVTKFAPGDLAGLAAMYPKSACG